MTTPYEQMTDEQLEALTESVLDEHEAGTARFASHGDAARHTVGTVPISLRIPAPLLESIKAAGAARGVPYQRLIKVWLEDALARNAPDTLPQPVTLRLTPEAVTRLRESGSLDIHLEAV
jgi:predicted DNA binding CopG/RHH family protein